MMTAEMETRSKPRPTCRPNVLLVVLDSVRAGNCSLYGYRNETTPFLAELATRASTFRQARAPGIHSMASHASIFSGLHVAEHNLTRHESLLRPDATVWAALADEYGYATGIFSPNVVLMESSNLSAPFATRVGPKRTLSSTLFDAGLSPSDRADGFSALEYVAAALRHDCPVRSLTNGVYHKLTHEAVHQPRLESADTYVDEFLEWATRQSQPWAACLNLMDAHYPYVPDTDADQWGGPPLAELRDDLSGRPLSKEFLSGRPIGQLQALEPLYDGCIRQLDRALSRLVTGLQADDMFSNTLLVITSDHGEGFGEKSQLSPVRIITHNWGIHECLTHVPLIVKVPGQSDDRMIEAPATLTRFVDAVKAAVSGADPVSAFTPPSGNVVTSTRRVKPPGDALDIDRNRREPYFGPWRAVYRRQGNAVIKHATRRSDSTSKLLRDSTRRRQPEESATAVVNQAFDELTETDVSVSSSTATIDDSVERRLEDLGYLR